MSKSNQLEADLINYFLAGTRPSWDAATDVYLALFTADPGEAMSLTNEATYPGYARTAIPKDGTVFGTPVSAGSISNIALVNCPVHSGGSPASQTITHAALISTSSGAGTGISWTLPQAITVYNGINPFIPIGNFTWTED